MCLHFETLCQLCHGPLVVSWTTVGCMHYKYQSPNLTHPVYPPKSVPQVEFLRAIHTETYNYNYNGEKNLCQLKQSTACADKMYLRSQWNLTTIISRYSYRSQCEWPFTVVLLIAPHSYTNPFYFSVLVARSWKSVQLLATATLCNLL